MQNELATRYSLAEVREINDFSRSKELTLLMRDSIYNLLVYANNEQVTAPFVNWEEYWHTYTATNPEAVQLEGHGLSLLQSAWERHTAARKAVAKVAKDYPENDPDSLDKIKKQLTAFPEDASIQSVSFLSNCAVVYMDLESIGEYSKAVQKREGITNGKSSAHGFVSNDVFLTDKEGNKCPVIIAPITRDRHAQRVFYHERAHILFGEGYLRDSVEASSPRENIRHANRLHVADSIANLDNPHMEDIHAAISPVIANLSTNLLLIFLNEAIAEASGGALHKPENQQDARYMPPLQMVNFFTSGKTWSLYKGSYGTFAREVLNGLVDGIFDTKMTASDKWKLWEEIENEAIRGIEKIKFFASCLEELWNQTPGNGEKKTVRYVSALYTLPLSRLYNVVWFLDEVEQNSFQGAWKRSEHQQYANDDIPWVSARKVLEDSPDASGLLITAQEDLIEDLQRKLESAIAKHHVFRRERFSAVHIQEITIRAFREKLIKQEDEMQRIYDRVVWDEGGVTTRMYTSSQQIRAITDLFMKESIDSDALLGIIAAQTKNADLAVLLNTIISGESGSGITLALIKRALDSVVDARVMQARQEEKEMRARFRIHGLV